MIKSRFAPEPPFSHGQAPKTGVLLCNLGTPEAPTPAALRQSPGDAFRAKPGTSSRRAPARRPKRFVLHGTALLRRRIG